MNAIFPSDSTEIFEIEDLYVGFEEEADTLHMGDVEISFDFQLGDEDLEVSLLVESLEEQYREMVTADSSDFIDVQSAKEWVQCYKHRMAGLCRYLKRLTAEDAISQA